MDSRYQGYRAICLGNDHRSEVLPRTRSLYLGSGHQRKFQFKMALPKIIQIPCHHVLSNQNALKLKKGAPLKQIFNINLGIGIIKKLLFLFVFRHISLCVQSNFNRESSLDVELNSASNEYPLGILLTGPATPKTRNT